MSLEGKVAYMLADTILTMVQIGFNADDIRAEVRAKEDAGMTPEQITAELRKQRGVEEALTKAAIERKLAAEGGSSASS